MSDKTENRRLLATIDSLIEYCEPVKDLDGFNEDSFLELIDVIQQLGTSWKSAGNYTRFITMDSDSIERNISNSGELDFDTTIATLICIGRELHWDNFSDAIKKRIPNGGLYKLALRLKELQNNPVIDDKKRQYLIKTLSRTKRKDYENYIINAIWHHLGRLDIQPVTQQYIKRKGGKYALVDLYFPQINYAVECDEAYHFKNEIKDEERELTMVEMLSSYDEADDFIIRRVKAYLSIASIDFQIEEIVKEINEILEKRNINKWEIDIPESELALRANWIDINDGLRYDTIVDICRCFGKQYTNMQRSYFSINNEYTLWCPQLAVYKDNQLVSPGAHGWVNYMSDDWDTIYEMNSGQNLLKERITDKDKKPRMTFAKCQNPFGKPNYRFIGAFAFDEVKSEGKIRAYRRIATRISLNLS